MAPMYFATNGITDASTGRQPWSSGSYFLFGDWIYQYEDASYPEYPLSAWYISSYRCFRDMNTQRKGIRSLPVQFNAACLETFAPASPNVLYHTELWKDALNRPNCVGTHADDGNYGPVTITSVGTDYLTAWLHDARPSPEFSTVDVPCIVKTDYYGTTIEKYWYGKYWDEQRGEWQSVGLVKWQIWEDGVLSNGHDFKYLVSATSTIPCHSCPDDMTGVNSYEATSCYSRGDVDIDGTIDVGDIFYLINFLFSSGPMPQGQGDVNGDHIVDVADVFYLINYLFSGGPPPIGGRHAGDVIPLSSAASLASGQDAIVAGSLTTGLTSGEVRIPLYFSDMAGTSIGGDRPVNQHITELAFQLVDDGNSCVAGLAFDDSTGILGAAVQAQPPVIYVHGGSSYLLVDEIPFTLGGMDKLGDAVLTLSGCGAAAIGWSVATSGPLSAFAGCSACPPTAPERASNGTLEVVSGTVTVNPTLVERLVNGGFETITSSTNAAPDGSWVRTAYSGTSYAVLTANGSSPHSGADYARLGRYTSSSQTLDSAAVVIPVGATSATLSVWIRVSTQEDYPAVYDTLRVQLIDGASGALLTQLTQVTNLSGSVYTQYAFDVAAYRGRSVKVRFLAVNGPVNVTDFYIDDVSLKANG